MDLRFDGKTAIVTGAASGIGLAIAEALAESGATVIVADLDKEKTEGAANSIGHGAVATTADVAKPEQVEAMIELAIEKTGRLDMLVNNAGIGGPRAPIGEVPTGEWDRTIAVNLNGAFYCMQAAVPHMKEAGGGCIINISTTSARTGLPNRSPYVASKVGLLGLTYTAARELGQFNIRCNAILPGYMDNPRGHALIAKHAEETGKSLEDARSEFMRFISMRTMIGMDEVADMAVFLASDAARHVSGQQIGVCGNQEYEI